MPTRLSKRLVAVVCLAAAVVVAVWQGRSPSAPAEGASPIAHWVIAANGVVDRAGSLTPTVVGKPTVVAQPVVSVEFRNEADALLAADKVKGNAAWLPRDAVSVAAWVRVDVPDRRGAAVSLFVGHHDRERGVLLGTDETRFRFAVSTDGQDVSAPATLLRSRTRYQRGRWYHVVGVCDGQTATLYVNGQREASAEAPGRIRYPGQAQLLLGRYEDEYEQRTLQGALHEAALYDRALTAAEVERLFAAERSLADRPAAPPPAHFVILPYLQYPTRDAVSILWETSAPGSSTVFYDTKTPMTLKVEEAAKGTNHEVRLMDLAPNTRYYYQVKSALADGTSLVSDIRTFQTAVGADDAFTFALIGDTQKNPEVTGRVARQIWARRPHFVVHLGDVVDNGPDKKEWEEELFRPCLDLFGRAAVFPCIGNHEKDHEYYYRHFALPKPKFYYQYRYGNADFFVVDTNRSVLPGSVQYEWLDSELGRSDALWKFVYHHHPVYSSDSDDYGNSWREGSALGDLKVRPLAALYEKHGVDMAFNGHVHVYERSWPVRGGKVDPKGVVYVTSGGGGGRLENFTPTPAWFKAQVRADYHFCLASLHRGRLAFQAFDQQGRLFDAFELRK